MPDWLACCSVNQGALLVACQLQVLELEMIRKSPVDVIPASETLVDIAVKTQDDGAESLILATKPVCPCRLVTVLTRLVCSALTVGKSLDCVSPAR